MGGLAVNRVRAQIEGENRVAVDVEHRAQVAGDHDGVDGSLLQGGKAVDSVRAQARVERIKTEDMPRPACGLLLIDKQGMELVPEQRRCLVRVQAGHFPTGGCESSAMAFSMSTARPCSHSARPCQNEAGTGGSRRGFLPTTTGLLRGRALTGVGALDLPVVTAMVTTLLSLSVRRA
jgi:hypothetical protein